MRSRMLKMLKSNRVRLLCRKCLHFTIFYQTFSLFIHILSSSSSSSSSFHLKWKYSENCQVYVFAIIGSWVPKFLNCFSFYNYTDVHKWYSMQILVLLFHYYRYLRTSLPGGKSSQYLLGVHITAAGVRGMENFESLRWETSFYIAQKTILSQTWMCKSPLLGSVGVLIKI